MAMNKDFPLTEKEFWDIYMKVPRLCVDIIIRTEKGVLLTKRGVPPCEGLWHLPGGTVFFGEKLTDAVQRVAQRELGINVTDINMLDYVEYPSHHQTGLDSPVSIAFTALPTSEKIKINDEAEDWGWFTSVPDAMHPDQDTLLLHKVFKK